MTPIKVEGGEVVAFVAQPNAVMAVAVTPDGLIRAVPLTILRALTAETPEPAADAEPTKVARKRGS